jgi:hypothetical protein
MVRGPQSGNGTRSSVYCVDSADLVSPWSQPRAQRLTLESEMDPLAAVMQADGSLAARPGIGGSSRGAGGRWLPAPVPRGSDQVAQSQLMNELPAFFQAYASGDSAALNRFEVHGVSVAGLGGAVTFDQISALHVPPGGTTRQITVTVIWQLSEPSGSAAAGNPGVTAKLEMTYGMSVVDLQGGKWYVKGIGASSEAVGAR